LDKAVLFPESEMRIAQLLVGVTLVSVSAESASAPEYPSRPIRLIVPFAPGGGTDIVARVIAQRVSESVRQPVVVDNRAGGGGTIGAEMAVRASTDGYTLIMGSGSYAAAAALYKLPYDPVTDIQPIILIGETGFVFAVHPSVPVRSVKELIAYAKANPGKLNFGSAGLGNASHLAAELFKLRTGTDIVHVPYKGAADAVTGVLSGQVQMFFGDIGGVMPLIREGRLRALALSSDARSKEIPELPTMIESGVPDYVVLTYIGVVAPAATPRAIVDKLNAAINASLQTPEVVAAAKRLSAELRPASADDFGNFLAHERDKWDAVVRQSGIKIQ